MLGCRILRSGADSPPSCVRTALPQHRENRTFPAPNGTTSFAFAQDETSAAKVISDNAKKLEDKISAKSGYVNGEYVDAKGVAVLAAIPSKEVLVATLAGTLKGMISGLAVALNKVAEKMGE